MSVSKKTCPFTDQPCTDCCPVFAEEQAGKREQNLRGCDLVRKAAAPIPR